MRFDIKNTVDVGEIKASSNLLNEKLIVELSREVRPHLFKLQPAQFIFLLVNLSSKGTNLEANIALINDYFAKLSEPNLKLELEAYLANLFLKNYETEIAYNDFFKIIASHTKNPKSCDLQTNFKNEITFFCHAPVLLAHTNPMFKMLRERKRSDLKINILSLHEDKKFTATCEAVGAQFKKLEATNYVTAYDQLIEFSKEHVALVWLCLPMHLAYVSAHSSNLVWWSHKMHPGIDGPLIRLHANEPAKVNDHFWHHFDCGFDLKNEGAHKVPFEERSKNFGSFCRVELINNRQHWLNVRSILSLDNELSYNYTGRSSIHESWCSELNIDPRRVKFLGWLKDPHSKIREMAFLLDCVKLGQGLMALEAIAAKVPVLSPKGNIGAFIGFLLRIFLPADNELNAIEQSSQIFDKSGNLSTEAFALLDRHALYNSTVFSNEEGLLKNARNFLDQTGNKHISDLLHSYLVTEMKSKSKFEAFMKIILEHQPLAKRQR